MNSSLVKKYVPVIALFIFINVMVFIFKDFLISYGFDIPFLLVANGILFLLSLFGFFIQTKGVHSANVNAFVRGLYSSLLLKIFVVAGAILVYLLVIGGKVNRPSLFTSLALYLLYTSIEVVQLMKLARKKKDA